ncbi:MAG: hypothetical protein JJE39_14135, partial [Vicinamibacteria bacterium]|nr:hypothetical protein [Vicinamibacteria bacterium]
MRATSLLTAALVAAPVFAPAQTPAAPSKLVRHTMSVSVDPKTHRLKVTDEIAMPQGARPEFLLNGNLRLTNSTPPLHEVPLGETEAFFGINAGEAGAGGLTLKRYRAEGTPAVVKISYEGAFDF